MHALPRQLYLCPRRQELHRLRLLAWLWWPYLRYLPRGELAATRLCCGVFKVVVF